MGALENMKQGQVSTLAHDLSALEQKVAKWVHAHPLPAKVGEARLYSLEARLKEEMHARLELEMMIKDKSNYKVMDKWALPPVGGEPLGSARNSSGRKAKKDLVQV